MGETNTRVSLGLPSLQAGEGHTHTHPSTPNMWAPIGWRRRWAKDRQVSQGRGHPGWGPGGMGAESGAPGAPSPSQRRYSGSRLPGLQAEGVRARTLGSRLLGEVWGPKSPPLWGIEVGGSGPSVGKGPWPAARVPAAGSPGPWRSTAAGWGEVPAWGCASRSGISPHCPLAADGLCWGDRGTEAGAMGSPASCPFSSMLARSGDREWRGGKVDEGGKSLRGGCVKVLHSICQQIWKAQQWPQDWKRSVFIPIPK